MLSVQNQYKEQRNSQESCLLLVKTILCVHVSVCMGFALVSAFLGGL